MNMTFWQGDTYAIVKAMKATGNRIGVIDGWKAAVAEWAQRTPGMEAEAVKAWLPLWQARPFYTCEELAPLWPALAIAIGHSVRMLPQKSAKRLEHELDYAGLPSFAFRDKKYYVVERLHHWRNATEQEIENALAG